MPWWAWLTAACVILALVILALCWSYAARIDRMHRRLAAARLGLDRHLVRRSAESLRIADSAPLAAEETTLLREAATAALLASEYSLATDALGGFARQGSGTVPQTAQRLDAESALSRILRQVLTEDNRTVLEQDALLAAQLQALDAASSRARLARTLHNQDALQVRTLRSKPLVRVFHLAGHAPQPQFVDVDDQ